ncbi:hypothetical protein K505DRAFT_6359 [Melanomma pulvis-pyrius CBS 109.77]|uniref:Uncharacterized protein n=1 Tax=Melanomma pulvis-pyrius CBS 109.77 TaxID=1314802 RepID=A0A6A6WP41_9PLEO|nr:hypothetical protein K505DRAFT_6359 [Melanomma pulvis-pyrius CBS 109.77]
MRDKREGTTWFEDGGMHAWLGGRKERDSRGIVYMYVAKGKCGSLCTCLCGTCEDWVRIRLWCTTPTCSNFLYSPSFVSSPMVLLAGTLFPFFFLFLFFAARILEWNMSWCMGM